MKQTKRIMTLLIVLTLTTNVKSQEYFEIDGIVYRTTSEETVEVAPYYALSNNPYSGHITIPQTITHNGNNYTVTALGDLAFERCIGVTSLTLPATIRHIGSYCFYNCNFPSLQLPDSLRTLGDHAFLYSRVSSLHLPAHFESYGDATFWARNLTSITVDEANPLYRIIDGCLYSKDSTTLRIVPDGRTQAVIIPSYVRHIDRMAFGFNTHITSVTLSEGLQSIGAFAFNICPAVNNIVIPSTVTSIGICPFSYCPALDNISIASGNTHYVMDGTMIYSIGYDTLVSCHKSGPTVTLNPNLRVLGGFENNTWLQHIDIPTTVTDITDNCFNGCSITSIDLQAHLKSIGTMAFATNSNLRSVKIQQVDTIGAAAFSQTNLDYIKFTVGIPPFVTGNGPLYDIGSLDSIIVPCGTLDTWLADEYWGRKEFASKYFEDCSSIYEPDADDIKIYSLGGHIIVEGADGEKVWIFDIEGREMRNEALPTGVYVVKVGNRPARKVVIAK